MYEHRTQPLLTRVQFARRVISHFGYSILACAIALGAGVAGYHFIGDLKWVDSLLNASMILGGMGPVDPLQTNAAKVFASFYALFSGLVFIGVLGLLLAPFIHRVMHKLHMESEDDSK
jgi:hypothetical protein